MKQARMKFFERRAQKISRLNPNIVQFALRQGDDEILDLSNKISELVY